MMTVEYELVSVLPIRLPGAAKEVRFLHENEDDTWRAAELFGSAIGFHRSGGVIHCRREPSSNLRGHSVVGGFVEPLAEFFEREAPEAIDATKITVRINGAVHRALVRGAWSRRETLKRIFDVFHDEFARADLVPKGGPTG